MKFSHLGSEEADEYTDTFQSYQSYQIGGHTIELETSDEVFSQR